jgi:hypothetical protein
MSLLDKASLVVTPNAYKASKLYSVIPSSGAGDLDVVRATTATRVNSLGLIESVAVNVPRVDYTNGSCPSLLVEGQRTNLVTYSEQFDNAAWLKALTNVTANSIISPDGNTTADTIIPDATLNNHWVGKTSFTLVSGTAYSYSVYAKNNGYNLVLSVGSATIYTNCNFNLSNGTASTPYATAGANLCTPVITNVGNGWYRCTINFTASMISNAILYSSNNTTTTPIGAFGMITMSGNNTSGYYLWGAQLEVGTYSTSLIPTVASTITRNADVISKTGISSLIGQTEGTIYAEIKVNKLIGIASRYIFHISDGTANNRIYIAFSGSSSNVIRGRIFSGGTLQCSIDSSTITTTGTYKLALAYKNNDIVFYINGVQIGVDTSASIPTCSRVDIGQNYAGASQLGDGISNANIFKTRLTNAELAQLTTI